MDQILKLLDLAEDEDNVLLANNVSTAAFRRVLDSGAAQITDMVLEEYPEPFKSYNQDGRLERTYWKTYSPTGSGRKSPPRTTPPS